MNFSNFRHVDRPICRSQMSRKWSQAAWPVPSVGAKAVVPSSWNMPVYVEAVDAIQLIDEPRAARVRVFQDDEVLAGRALEGRARRGER